jgi:fucose permease
VREIVNVNNVTKVAPVSEITGLPDPKHAQSSIENDGTHRSGNNKYREILGSRTVQLMAFFIWVYVGLEVTIGGKYIYSSLERVLIYVYIGWIVTVCSNRPHACDC